MSTENQHAALQVIIPKCDCGTPAPKRCSDIWSEHTLTPCHAPLCMNGCKTHRHEPGSMGYSATMKGRTRYAGDEPDDSGLLEWLKSRYRAIFWSAQKKADLVYKEVCSSFAPPAPWPYLQLQVGSRLFESRGPNGIVEVTNTGFSEHLGRTGL